MSRVIAASFAVIVAAAVLPTAASAGCYNCYTPQPCATCYQQQYIPPQYATQERVEMVSPGYSYYAPVMPRCASCGY